LAEGIPAIDAANKVLEGAFFELGRKEMKIYPPTIDEKVDILIESMKQSGMTLKALGEYVEILEKRIDLIETTIAKFAKY
jgi:hypothetical protein